MYKKISIIKYFLILYLAVFFPNNALALTLTSQSDVTVTAQVGIGNPITGGGGGGSYQAAVIFKGYAYPGATVHILENGSPSTTTVADQSGSFEVTIYEQYSLNILYTLYAIDKENRRSTILNYPVAITTGYYTELSGIKFAPTISTDKTEVKLGDSITLSGYALPTSDIQISFDGPASAKFSGQSSADGKYNFTYNLGNFPKGDYDIKVNYKDDKRVSKVVKFVIGDINISSTELVLNIPGDCNADHIINLVDFSVMAFWYGKPNPPDCVDANHDGTIDLIDFSILAYYWTG